MFSPSRGKLKIPGLAPDEAIRKYSGAIGYVPQDVAIVDGALRENIAMGFPAFEASDCRVNYAIKIAQLEDFEFSLPDVFDSQLGSRGTNLSGGQRQRLGIARAFFTKPKLLFLDESSSALDSKTELLISNALIKIDYKITLIDIDHCLSTIQDASQIIYLDEGSISASGTFDKLGKTVPNFEDQAKLMGL